jgi:hypothetical protein
MIAYSSRSDNTFDRDVAALDCLQGLPIQPVRNPCGRWRQRRPRDLVALAASEFQVTFGQKDRDNPGGDPNASNGRDGKAFDIRRATTSAYGSEIVVR